MIIPTVALWNNNNNSNDKYYRSENYKSPKCEIPCPGRRWTTVQNLTPLALSSVEKSSTVQTHRKKLQTNKYVRLRGLTYIHTCRSYVHTPRELDRHAVESSTGTFIVLHALADSSDFGLLGEQSSPKWEIPCLGRRRTALQNLTPIALSSAEKSVTVQTHTQITKKNKQAVNDISTPCLSACVDKNILVIIYFIYVNIWTIECR